MVRLVPGRQRRASEPDEYLRSRVEAEGRVAGDQAEADDPAPFAGHDRLLQHDQVARRPERYERVRGRRHGLAVHRQPDDASAAQAVSRDVDVLGVDQAAGERDACE
jgi:hypothetical protein